MSRCKWLGILIVVCAPAWAEDAAPVVTAPPKKALTPTIKEIMQEAHQCKTAYIREVRDEIEKEQAYWDR